MKKKILLLSAGCLLTLASCGGESASSQPSSTETPTSESQSSLPVGSIDSESEAIKALSKALSSIDMSEISVYAGLSGKLSVETTSYNYVSTDEEDTTILSKSGYSFNFGSGLALNAIIAGLDNEDSSAFKGEASLTGELEFTTVTGQTLYHKTKDGPVEKTPGEEESHTFCCGGISETAHLANDRVYFDLSDSLIESISYYVASIKGEATDLPSKIKTPEIGSTGLSPADAAKQYLDGISGSIGDYVGIASLVGGLTYSKSEDMYYLYLDIDGELLYVNMLAMIAASLSGGDLTPEQLQQIVAELAKATAGTHFSDARMTIGYNEDGSYLSLTTSDLSGLLRITDVVPGFEDETYVASEVAMDQLTLSFELNPSEGEDLSWQPESEEAYQEVYLG